MDEEHEVKRTIEEIKDSKTGEIIYADKFFQLSEQEIARYRRYLEEAIQLKQPRFVCPYCNQMVKLCGRRTQKGKVLFFSHLHNSADCDIKTTEQLTKEEIIAKRYGTVQESVRHKKLKEFIYKHLNTRESQELGISHVEASPKVTSDIPYLEWRRPDIVADFKDRQLVFELQLSTTFLSVVVERDIFYRLNNYFVVWVFNFEDAEKFVKECCFEEEFRKRTAEVDNHEDKSENTEKKTTAMIIKEESAERKPIIGGQRFSLGNLTSKDIYYANKRNVFILDEEARIKSMECNQLFLSVTWLDETGKFVPLQLISIKDLSFDEESCKPYYFDADQAYYSLHPEEKKRIATLERSKQEILQALMSRQKSRDSKEHNQQEELQNCKEEILRSGSCVSPYTKGKKYGYEFNGYPVTKPIYSDAGCIQAPGYGLVVKNRKKGAVNRLGEEVVPCRFRDLHILPNHTFLVDEDGKWFIFKNSECINKKKRDDVVTINSITKQLVHVQIKRTKDTLSFVVNSDGNFHYFDNIGMKDGYLIPATEHGKWIPGRNIYNGRYWEYERKKYEPGEECFLTEEGYIISQDVDIYKNLIPAHSFDMKQGLLNAQFQPISNFSYDTLYTLNNYYVQVGISGYYGLLVRNDNGYYEQKIKCKYTKLNMLTDSWFKVLNGKWGLVDSEDNAILPTQYDEISSFEDNAFHVNIDGKWGKIDMEGNPIIEDVKEIKDGLRIGKAFGRYGIVDRLDRKIVAFDYSKILFFHVGDGVFLADDCVYDLTGKILLHGVRDLKPLISTIVLCDINGEKRLFSSDFIPLLAEFHIQNASVEEGHKVHVILTNGSTGYLSDSGQPIQDAEQSFKNGLIAYKAFGYWGLKSNNDKVIAMPKFRQFSEARNGNIIAFSDSGFVSFDSKGNTLGQFNEGNVVNVLDESLFVFKKESQNRINDRTAYCGLCDNHGKILIPCKYNHISYLGEGLYLTKLVQSEKWHKFVYFGLIDNQGKELLPCKYRSISLKDNQYVDVLDRYMHKIYNLSLTLLCRYYKIEKLTDSLSKIDVVNTYYGSPSKWGIVDSYWHVVLPAKYDEVNLLSPSWIVYRKNKSWGCMSIDHQQIIPCRCPNIAVSQEGVPIVQIGNTVISCSEYVQFYNGQGMMEIGKYYWGIIIDKRVYGLMLQMENGERCLLHGTSLKQVGKTTDEFNLGERVLVKILGYDDKKKRYKICL